MPLGPSSTCAAAVRPLPPDAPWRRLSPSFVPRGCTLADIRDLADEAGDPSTNSPTRAPTNEGTEHTHHRPPETGTLADVTETEEGLNRPRMSGGLHSLEG